MKALNGKLSVLCFFGSLLFAANANADSYCDDCDAKCFGGSFSFENVIVRPHFTRNNAYFLEEPNGVDGQKAHQFKSGYCYSPRFELAWEGQCNVGLRGRYWYFDDKTTLNARNSDDEIATWFADDSSDDLGFDNSSHARLSHDMRFHVADLEATFEHCQWIFFVGGRYANMHQEYKAEDLSDSAEVKSKISFEGVGLTAGADYLHPIKCNFSLYVKARASLLYGDSDWKAYNETVKLSTSSCRDLIPVGELQFGIDWRKCFCDNKIGFIRFGIETQYWGSAGSAAPGCNAVYDEGNYQNSHPQDPSLGFVGFNVTLGVIF